MKDVAETKKGQAAALAEALEVCFPELDIAGLRPLQHRPHIPLKGLRLNRAINMILRQSQGTLTLAELVSALVNRHGLTFLVPGTRDRFIKRVETQLTILAAERASRQTSQVQQR